MALRELKLQPEEANYSVQESGGFLYSRPAPGGFGRRRAAPKRQVKLVNCYWVLDELEYKYQRAFIRTALKEASLPFLIRLMIGRTTALDLYQASIVKDSFSLVQQRGLSYSTQAQLAVVPVSLG